MTVPPGDMSPEMSDLLKEVRERYPALELPITADDEVDADDTTREIDVEHEAGRRD